MILGYLDIEDYIFLYIKKHVSNLYIPTHIRYDTYTVPILYLYDTRPILGDQVIIGSLDTFHLPLPAACSGLPPD